MPPTAFLSVDVVLQIHARVVEEFGGDSGLRDRGLLESAVAMPQSTFAGEFLHVSVAEKAAAYHYHLCANHPFADGNKRVAVAAAEVFLLMNGCELTAEDNELEEITLGVAGGELSKETVIAFFKQHISEA
ncbi:MAG: type II toxin-antitoxin system death-on-curing family toxin [Deltaproteobacteria bacterium]|nr:type II toxin-antitoxin system death-on-curing family toxin [Deltaproteobacteria bacterium]